jgi:hypothetical protein
MLFLLRNVHNLFKICYLLVHWKRIHPTGIFILVLFTSIFVNNFDRFSGLYCIIQINILYGIPRDTTHPEHMYCVQSLDQGHARFYAFHVSTVTCGPCFLAKSV